MRDSFALTVAVLVANACVQGLAIETAVTSWSYRYGSKLQKLDLNDRIDAVSRKGGGRVVVPSGRWECDPVVLKSNVELHLDSKAEIVFTDEIEKYLPSVRTSYEGVECYNYRPLVYAYGATNIAITGSGTMRPMMGRWETWRWNAVTCREAKRVLDEEWGAKDVSVEKRDLTKLPGSKTRPPFIGLNACSGVRLEGFSIRDSPFWCIHLLHCENVEARGLSVRAFLNNSDGIDVECSRNVLIEECSFDQGDDVIVLKSGKDRDGRRRATPTENVTVRHCRAGAGHGFLVIGSECSGGVRNVTMEDCVVDGTLDTLFKVKTSDKRGGFVHDITMRRVTAKTILSAVIDLNAAYAVNASARSAEEIITDIAGLTIEDVFVSSAGTRYEINGDARQPIRMVCIRNLLIGTCDNRSVCVHAEVVDR